MSSTFFGLILAASSPSLTSMASCGSDPGLSDISSRWQNAYCKRSAQWTRLRPRSDRWRRTHPRSKGQRVRQCSLPNKITLIILCRTQDQPKGRSSRYAQHVFRPCNARYSSSSRCDQSAGVIACISQICPRPQYLAVPSLLQGS